MMLPISIHKAVFTVVTLAALSLSLANDALGQIVLSAPPAHNSLKKINKLNYLVPSSPPSHSLVERYNKLMMKNAENDHQLIRRDYQFVVPMPANPCQFRVSVYKGDTLAYSSGGANNNNYNTNYINNNNNNNNNNNFNYGNKNVLYGGPNSNNNNNFANYQPKGGTSGCPGGNNQQPSGNYKPYGPGPGECRDAHPLCCFWATLGQCDANVFWMRPNCQFACGTCGCIRDNALNCVVKLGNCGTTKSPFTKPTPIVTSTTLKVTTTSLKVTKPVVTTPPATKPDVKTSTSTSTSTKTTTITSTTASPDKCEDKHDLCCFWASLEQCDMNPYWMRPNCQKACGTCGCTSKTASTCTVKLGSCGPIGPPYRAKTTTTAAPEDETVTEAVTVSTVPAKPSPPPSSTTFSLPGDCEDLNELCCYWASLGHCDMNVFWMRPNCQKACGTCGCKHEEADTCKVNLNEACIEKQPLTPAYVAPSDSTEPVTAPTDAPSKVTGYVAPTNYKAPEEPETKEPTYIQPVPGPDVGPTYQAFTGSPPSPSTGDCVDQSELCCFWASLGHCDSNLFWMRPNCQKACGTCGCTFENVLDCKPTGSECIVPDSQGYVNPKPKPVPEPVPEKPRPTRKPKRTARPPPPAKEYVALTRTPAAANEESKPGECKDENELCCFWASIGHCDLNKYWMRPHCPQACGTCGCTLDNADECRVNIPDSCVAKPEVEAPPITTTQQPVDQSGQQGGDENEIGFDNLPGPPAPNVDTAPPAATNALEKPTTAVLPINPPVYDAEEGEQGTGGDGTGPEDPQSYDYPTDDPVAYSSPTLDPAIPQPKPVAAGGPGVYGTLSKNPNNQPLYPNYQGGLAPGRAKPRAKRFRLASHDSFIRKRSMA